MSELPDALRREVVAEAYRQAGELDWDGLTDKQRSATYDRWLDDPGIGHQLTRFLSGERARVWLKDVPMKEYARARTGSEYIPIWLPYVSPARVRLPGRSWVKDGTS